MQLVIVFSKLWWVVTFTLWPIYSRVPLTARLSGSQSQHDLGTEGRNFLGGGGEGGGEHTASPVRPASPWSAVWSLNLCEKTECNVIFLCKCKNTYEMGVPVDKVCICWCSYLLYWYIIGLYLSVHRDWFQLCVCVRDQRNYNGY